MEKKDLENRMGKFVRDFRIYTETSGSVDYEVLRNGLRMFIQAELDRAREEGRREQQKLDCELYGTAVATDKEVEEMWKIGQEAEERAREGAVFTDMELIAIKIAVQRSLKFEKGFGTKNEMIPNGYEEILRKLSKLTTK